MYSNKEGSMYSNYVAKGFIFNKEGTRGLNRNREAIFLKGSGSHFAIMREVGHDGKPAGKLDLPGGKEREGDKDSSKTLVREVVRETMLHFEILDYLRDGVPVKRPQRTCGKCGSENIDEKVMFNTSSRKYACRNCGNEMPSKIVLQYVYLCQATDEGEPNRVVKGETDGWFWEPFSPVKPPNDLFRTYKYLWNDDRFLTLTLPFCHKI